MAMTEEQKKARKWVRERINQLEISEHVRKIVEEAPPLTDQQKAELRRIFSSVM